MQGFCEICLMREATAATFHARCQPSAGRKISLCVLALLAPLHEEFSSSALCALAPGVGAMAEGRRQRREDRGA